MASSLSRVIHRYPISIVNSQLSIGVQTGPPIGAEQGPPWRQWDPLMLGASFALLVAQGGRSPTGGTSRAKVISGGYWGGSAAVLEAPAVVASLDDIAVMGDAVEQRGGHLWIAEHGRPFAERQVGGNDHRGLLV